MMISLAFILALGITGCGSESSDSTVVNDGTYEGTITEVNAEETEIYVDIPNEGTLELYFKDQTKLLKNEKEVPFKTLQNGQKVEVKVERVGKRLDPLTVRILE
jgi:ribosomal protein S1